MKTVLSPKLGNSHSELNSLNVHISISKKRERPKLLLPIRIERLGKSAVPVPTVVLCSPMDAFMGLTMLKKNLKILLIVLPGWRVQWQFLSRRSKHFRQHMLIASETQ